MWFRLFGGATAISAGQQQFTGDEKGYFEAPDHLHPAIVASGGAMAIGPHHPDHPPQAVEPTVIEGPEAVAVGPLSDGPVNLPGSDPDDAAPAPVDAPDPPEAA